MKRLLLLGAFFALSCAMSQSTEANTNANKCTFKIRITNATGQKIVVRRLYYKVTHWERVGGHNNPLQIKKGKTRGKAVMNVAVSCQKQHIWKFQYRCTQAYRVGNVTKGPTRRVLRHKLRGKNYGGWVTAQVKIHDCEGKATWTKKDPAK